MPSINTTIEFADHSLTAGPAVYEQMLGAESDRDPRDASFVVNKSQNTTHASYDNRDYMSERLQPTIYRVIHDSAYEE